MDVENTSRLHYGDILVIVAYFVIVIGVGILVSSVFFSPVII